MKPHLNHALTILIVFTVSIGSKNALGQGYSVDPTIIDRNLLASNPLTIKISNHKKILRCFFIQPTTKNVIVPVSRLCLRGVESKGIIVHQISPGEGRVAIWEINHPKDKKQIVIKTARPLIVLNQEQEMLESTCLEIVHDGGVGAPRFQLGIGSSKGAKVTGKMLCAGLPGEIFLELTDNVGEKISRVFKVLRKDLELTMEVKKWRALYGSGTALNPTQISPTQWEFRFPTISEGQLHYLLLQAGGRIRKQFLQANLKISGSPEVEFDYKTEKQNTCTYPAHARFMIRRGASLSFAQDRWWANPIAFRLEPGEAHLKVAIDPTQWTTVDGSRGSDSPETLINFWRTMNDVSEIGFTFGGGCFFGHGVRTINGEATLEVSDFELSD